MKTKEQVKLEEDAWRDYLIARERAGQTWQTYEIASEKARRAWEAYQTLISKGEGGQMTEQEIEMKKAEHLIKVLDTIDNLCKIPHVVEEEEGK